MPRTAYLVGWRYSSHLLLFLRSKRCPKEAARTQTQNGADENHQPSFVRQVITGTPMPQIHAMCMTPDREFSIHVASFTGNEGSSTDSARRMATWRLVASDAKSDPDLRAPREAVLCPPQSGLFPTRGRGEYCESIVHCGDPRKGCSLTRAGFSHVSPDGRPGHVLKDASSCQSHRRRFDSGYHGCCGADSTRL